MDSGCRARLLAEPLGTVRNPPRAGCRWLPGVLMVGLSAAIAAGDEAALRLEVPPGFVVERVAGEPQVRFPMFAAFDDRGRLYVAESSGGDLYEELQAQTRRCRIVRLEDRTGDGKFDTSTVFADQLVFPMGLAWRGGRLYVADPPDLVVYDDADDGPRRREVLLTGFGHTDNGSLHGLTFGPDGWLYMTMGHPDGYRLERSDGTVLAGTNGALFRVRPDGGDPEVVCRGFTNLVEVAFLADGSAIGTVNFYQNPSGGLRDALVHLVAGGLYPQNTYEDETEHVVTGGLLPPATLLPITGISGIVRYRGLGFPEALRGNLFSAQHNTRLVQRHVLHRQGATWVSEDHDFLTTSDPDFHPSDVLEDADGSLLVVDTGAWYVQHCPTGRIQRSEAAGGIYRVRFAEAAPHGDAWGARIDWSDLAAEPLIERLADPRPAVADRAEWELERRGEEVAAAVAGWIARQPAGEPRCRAAWLLARRGDRASLSALRDLLASDDDQLAAVAARGVALGADQASAARLVELLRRREPAVRLAAALALTECGGRAELPALWEALAEPSDPFLTHALVYAVSRLADAEDLLEALDHPVPQVQRGALVLLDQPPHQCLPQRAVVARLGSPDEALRQAALESLTRHPEWAEPARQRIDELLTARSLSEEEAQSLRALVLAFQSQRRVAAEIGRAVAGERPDVPAEHRRLLLGALGESMAAEVPPAWNRAVGAALEDSDPGVRSAAARTAVALDLQGLLPRLLELSQDEATEPVLRLDLLRAIARHGRPDAASIQWLFERVADDDRPLDQLAASEVLARIALEAEEVRRLLELIRDRPLVSPSVLWPLIERSASGSAAAGVVEFLGARLSDGWRPAEEELAQVVSRLPPSQQAAGEALARTLREGRERQASELSGYLPLAAAGNPARGREVFFGTQAACATCHRVGADGGAIGPDLTRIGASRSVRDLVESIVVPSSTIAQGYETYTVQTTAGLVFSGILARQTPELLVLADSAGKETRVKRSEVEAMVRSSASIMPDGFGRNLSPEQLGDLLAWLQSLR